MEISVSLPLDSDGFLRRQCPHCNGCFKWHNGPANEEAESAAPIEAYFCPHCGQPAEPDRWFTDEQVEYINRMAAPAVLGHADDLLKQSLKGLDSKFFKVEMTGGMAIPGVPMALTEPDDMVIVTSPCHSYEPVKVPEDMSGTMHCLVCGDGFAV